MAQDWIWSRSEWPHFRYEAQAFAEDIRRYLYLRGVLAGKAGHLEAEPQKRLLSSAIVEETLKSSEIEGESLSVDSLWSSVAKRLNLSGQKAGAADRKAENAVAIVFDAIDNTASPLDSKRIFGWHRLLFEGEPPIARPPVVGGWRTDKVYVVSTSGKRQEIVFEGIPAEQLAEETERLFSWIGELNEREPLVKSAIAHLWFVLIHPFGDGNGRIARAIADNVLSREEEALMQGEQPEGFRHARYFSMSAQICGDRKSYYAAIAQANASHTLDITDWLCWYVQTAVRAVENAIAQLQKTIDTRSLVQRMDTGTWNARQIAMMCRLVDGSFIGKLTTEKWAALQKCTVYTAGRDIKALVDAGFLSRSESGGRSTSYQLASDISSILGA